MKIVKVSDVEVAFPTNVDHLIPAWDEIPDEFKHYSRKNKWISLFNDWFCFGLSNLKLTPKEGVNQQDALRMIKACMGSFSLKHEHKMAGVAYMLSEFFEDATWTRSTQ